MKNKELNREPLFETDDKNYEKTALRVSVITIIANVILAIFKFVAGIVASSGAMISDAVHSASDVFSTIVVIIGVKLSSKGSDKDHPYGHERFECVAAIILSFTLVVTGLFIGIDAVEKLSPENKVQPVIPGVLALIAAGVSIITKETMYWYTRYYAKKFASGALLADAWHHRSDALSSIGALIGIAGARMGFAKLDTIASLIICIFIFKTGYDIFKDAVSKMVDRSCNEEKTEQLRECALGQKNVLGVDKIRTRVFGNRIYVDIEICADGNITLNESHEIAECVHDAIEEKFPDVKHIMVHVNPV